MTKRLSMLEQAGLITRVPDPADRRSRVVEITESGGRLVESMLAARLKHEKRLLGRLRKRQRRDLAEALHDLCIASATMPRASRGEDNGRPTTRQQGRLRSEEIRLLVGEDTLGDSKNAAIDRAKRPDEV